VLGRPHRGDLDLDGVRRGRRRDDPSNGEQENGRTPRSGHGWAAGALTMMSVVPYFRSRRSSRRGAPLSMRSMTAWFGRTGRAATRTGEGALLSQKSALAAASPTPQTGASRRGRDTSHPGSPRVDAIRRVRDRGPYSREVEPLDVALDRLLERLPQPGELAHGGLARGACARVAGDGEQHGRRQLRVDEAVEEGGDGGAGHAWLRRGPATRPGARGARRGGRSSPS